MVKFSYVAVTLNTLQTNTHMFAAYFIEVCNKKDPTDNKWVLFIEFCYPCVCPLQSINLFFPFLVFRCHKKASNETKSTKVTYRSTTSTWSTIRAGGSRITLKERIAQWENMNSKCKILITITGVSYYHLGTVGSRRTRRSDGASQTLREEKMPCQ